MKKQAVKYSKVAVSALLVSCLAFVPLNVQMVNGLHIERNEAHAIAPVFAGAAAFLSELAAAAGGMTTGELIATVAGMTAVGTGMSIATDAGIRYGTEASQNLNNLIDAADYPSWDTLSSSEQSAWGSKDNYDSAKFNSLMAAYGLGGAYERYQSAWGSGGAGNFSFSSSEQDNLDQIASIGENWMNGLGNTVQDILNPMSDETVIYQYMGQTDYTIIDGSNRSDWPSGVPTTIYLYSGSMMALLGGTQNVFYFQPGCYFYVIQSSTSTNNYVCDMFSMTQFKQAFKTNMNDVPTQNNYSNVRSSTYNGQTYYHNFGTYNLGSNASFVNVSPSPNPISNMSNASGLAAYLLFNDLVSEPEQVQPNITDYPGETNIDNSINIYFPSNGLTDDTPWDDFLTYQEEITEDLSGIITLLRHIDSDLHKFNYYNNGELKVFDNGVFEELSDIYSLLIEISGKLTNWGDIADAPDIIGDFDFDDIADRVPDLTEAISDLAPFGVLAILSETIAVLSQVAQIQEPVLSFPFQFGGFASQNWELEIDLTFLDDLKPMINFVCMTTLFFGLVSASMRIVELEAAS